MGPAPLASDATGTGAQDYNWVSGRATSVVIDPADSTGNTVFLGGAYGGLWKSTNAGSRSSSPGSVTWSALLDDQPTLSVGAIALQPGNSNVILIGTGEANNSDDSYYGLGILRSTDGGSTWGQIESAASGESFLGIGFTKIAFSTINPLVVVAATAGDNGLDLGLEEDSASTARGLYFSRDAGATWNRVILSDGSFPSSATAVVYNPSQGSGGTFYASIQRHGLYSSTDGQHFTRMTSQPTTGLASGSCPAGSNATSCLIYRGEFAVVPGRKEIYAWIVDVQADDDGNPSPIDEGIWRSMNGGSSWTFIPDNGITNCGDSAFGPDSGCGVEDGWYNLEVAAIPDGASTDIYAGAVNLYKCTLVSGGTTCTQGDWINLTHVYGCNPGALGAPAHVHPSQHGLAFIVANGKSPGYFAHDGGISRTLDGYIGLQAGTCAGTNQFDSLSETLGSMTPFVSLSIDPTNSDVLLGGAGDNGSPKTGTATTSTSWKNTLGGDGGFTAVNPSNPSEWFASNPYLTIVKCELGQACDDTSFLEVVDPATLGGDAGGFFTPYILDPQNSGEMLVGTCRVWQVSTAGSAPLQLSDDFETLGTGLCNGDETNMVAAIAAGGPVDGNGNSTVVYAVTSGYGPLSSRPGGEVWATTNAGVIMMGNVTQNVNPNGYAISAVAMDSSDGTGKTAYIGIMGFGTEQFPTSHVWKTTNAGASWTDWSGEAELPDSPVNALLVDSQTGVLYAGTDVGVFLSSTATANWTEVGPLPGPASSGFLPDVPVTALQMFNPDAGTKTLVASTYGRGVWSYVLVASAAFTNTISDPSQSVFPTQTATFHGTLTAKNGYSSPVNVGCAGPVGATCTAPATPITPTATYTLTATSNVAGDYSFGSNAVGTDPNQIRRDAAFTLHVVDVAVSVPVPNILQVEQGGISAATTFQVSALGSFSGTVLLSCSAGLPPGTACVFSPSNSVEVTPSTDANVILSVSAAAGAALGSTTVTISATPSGSPTAKDQAFALTVTAPAADFSIGLTPNPNATVVNQNITWNGSITALHGYSGSVGLTCTETFPSVCTIAPPTLTPSASGSAFKVTVGSATAENFSFAIQATDGTLTHATATEALTVGTDVTWTDTGSNTATVGAGASAGYTFSAAPVGAPVFSSAVSFACSGLPALTSCSFNPPTIAAGSGAGTVSLTITTLGPNSGAQGQEREKAEVRAAATGVGRPNTLIPPMFALGWLVVAGIVGLGRKRRGEQRLYVVAWICLGLGFAAETSCGGAVGSAGTGEPPSQPVTVTVSAGVPSSVFPNDAADNWPSQTAQFSAVVANSSNAAVTWAVSGGGANGSIDANGLYTAPNVAAGLPAQVTITATSTADATKSGSANETLIPTTLPGTYSSIGVTATEGPAMHLDTVTLIVR